MDRAYPNTEHAKGARRSCRRDAARPETIDGQRGARLAACCILSVGLATATIADAASNIVRYTYDAAGNIVAIQRINTSLPSIAGFAPTTAAPGAAVTISGSGFATTLAGNAVAFNGVAATVTSASATTLTVTVPANASTGRISVGVGGNSAVSAQDFVVTTPGAPTIANFAPAAGGVGTTVTVTGTNFASAAGATSVRLNQTVASVATVAATQLAFAVPAAAGSGRIRVTTPGGSAVSAGDFVVPPAGVAAPDIIATTRLVADGAAQGIGLLAANRYGAILFDGNAGDWLSLQFGSFAINPAGGSIGYTIYKPDNTPLASGALSAAGLSIHVPQLPIAGTYAVLLSTGLAQVSLQARLESNLVVPANGSSLAIARTGGQTTRALIAATAGEQKALTVSELKIAPTGTNLDTTIALPGGSTFRKGTVVGLGTTSLLPPFTTTGTHSLLLAPAAGTTQSAFQVALVAGTALTLDAVALDLAIASPGAGVRVGFAGKAGENLGLGIRQLALSPTTSTSADFTVYRPDATLIASGRCSTDGTACSANLANLPVSGTYSVIVQPADGATGTMRMWVSHDVAGTLTSGVPLPVSLVRPGQNARLTFSGTAGASLAIQLRGITSTPAGLGMLAQVNRPDGTLFAYAHVTGSGQTLVVPPLPVTGTYTLLVEPEPAGKVPTTVKMDVLVGPAPGAAPSAPFLLAER